MKLQEIFKGDKDFYNFFYFIKNLKFEFQAENLFYTSAHKLNNGLDKNNDYENLWDHMEMVLDFFIQFAEKRNIDFYFVDDKDLNKKVIKNMLRSVFLHDIGKLNFEFQKKHYNFKDYGDTGHSVYSFFIGLIFFFNELEDLSNSGIYVSEKKKLKRNLKDKYVESFYLFLFLYVITLHHSNLGKFNLVNESEEDFLINFGKVIRNDFKNFIFDYENIFLDIIKIFPNKDEMFVKFNFLKKMIKEDNFFIPEILFKEEKQSLFFQIKQFYSLLVLSDYYATFAFQNNKKIEDLKIRQIDEKLLNKLEYNFHKIYYNQKLKDIKKEDIVEINKCEDVNQLRNNLICKATLSLQNELKKENHSKVFMLNVPTGGGKTNISLKLALEILKFDKKVNRLNWVFPYVNIIEQNTNVIKKHYFDDNLEDIKENLSQIYYDAIDLDDISKFEKFDELEDNKVELFEKKLNVDFINNPINIISSVNFFNMLFKVKRNNRYKFVNFVNSVIVIDEIQTIPANSLDVFYQVLDILSNNFNMYFIIMSATLPDVKMLNEIKESNSSAFNLIEDYKDFFNCEIFRRNFIEFRDEKFDKNKLVDLVKDLKQNKVYKKILVVLNTIKSSVEIFEELYNKKDDWNVLILNSFVSRDFKNKIVNFIKSKENEDEKIILVSTQSVEAGVDLNFDVAIRDLAILDSIEQVAGRVNRECNCENKSFKKVIVVNYKDEGNKIYKGDLRFDLFGELDKKEILESKNFNLYYEKYFEKINVGQKGSSLEDFFKYVQSLNFSSLSQLDIIKSSFSLTLVFDKISDELKKDFPKDWNFIFDVLDLVKGKQKSFENKVIFDFVNKVISKNSVQICFFSQDDFRNFVEFLINEDYVLNLKKDFNKSSMFFVNFKFFEKYFKSYFVKNKEFKYFDIFKLKEDFKKYKKDSNGIFF